MDKNDWRLMGQERYLKGKELYSTKYKILESNDHDHCEFCGYKFISGEQEGYCTTNYYHWICNECYNDFKEFFYWKVIE